MTISLTLVMGILIGLLIVVLLVWFVITTNHFKTIKLKVDEASSNIDILLNRRYDSLTKMMDCVKSYKDYEKGTLTDIVKVRQGMSVKEIDELNNTYNEYEEKIKLLVENYPDLKANTTYLELQEEISKIEDDLSNSRISYNNTVKEYNTSIKLVPSVIVAKIFGYKEKDYYQVEDEKKKDVKIKL